MPREVVACERALSGGSTPNISCTSVSAWLRATVGGVRGGVDDVRRRQLTDGVNGSMGTPNLFRLPIQPQESLSLLPEEFKSLPRDAASDNGEESAPRADSSLRNSPGLPRCGPDASDCAMAVAEALRTSSAAIRALSMPSSATKARLEESSSALRMSSTCLSNASSRSAARWSSASSNRTRSAWSVRSACCSARSARSRAAASRSSARNRSFSWVAFCSSFICWSQSHEDSAGTLRRITRDRAHS